MKNLDYVKAEMQAVLDMFCSALFKMEMNSFSTRNNIAKMLSIMMEQFYESNGGLGFGVSDQTTEEDVKNNKVTFEFYFENEVFQLPSKFEPPEPWFAPKGVKVPVEVQNSKMISIVDIKDYEVKL